MTADSAASMNGHNNEPASPPRITSKKAAKPGRQPSTTQAGFKAIGGEASPRRTDLSNCSVCDTKFTIFEHRHMCQKCQVPVCNRCSRSRKVFRASTKPKRVCDDCVKTFPSATKIVSDMSNTIESENRSQLTIPASDTADTCAERTIVSPSPATAFFGIGMVGMPSPRTLPPPTPAGGDESAPTPLATAFARLQVGAKAFFGGRRASGDNVENKTPDVQIAAATVKTHPSSSSLPPAQQHDRLQGDMEPVTNSDQGQAGSDDKRPDFDSAMSTAPVVPAVATTEMQEDAEPAHAQDTNEADTVDRAVLGLDTSHFSSAAADTPTNYYTPAAAAPAHCKEDVQKPVHSEVEAGDAVAICPHKIDEGDIIDGALVELKITAAEPTTGANSTPFLPASSPSIATPASPSTTAILSQDQEVVRNEVAVEATDGAQAEEPKKNDIVNGAELEAAETNASVTTTVDETVHEEVAKEDSEASDTSGTASSASTRGKKSGARSVRMHFTTEICGWGLAAVFMGLAVGLLLLERN